MKSPNNNSLNTTEKNTTSSKLHKTNNTVTIIFTSFIISLTLIIGALIGYLVRQDDQGSPSDDRLTPAAFDNNPVLFYSAPCYAPPCWRVYNTIVTTKYIWDPDRVFSLSLQTSTDDLENLVLLINGGAGSRQWWNEQQEHTKVSQSIFGSSNDENSNSETTTALNNCSDSLRKGSSQIQSIFRVSPFLGTQSGEQRRETIKRIMAAEENLKSCVQDLEKVRGSTVAIEVRAKVLQVKEYLSSSRENMFTHEYDDVWVKFWGDVAAEWRAALGNVFLVCVGGLQLLFMFVLFWTLIKFRCR